MILYNMRYRGAMEYDKFILNTFQFNNEVNEMVKNELGNTESIGELITEIEKIEESYAYYVGRKGSDNQAAIIGLS